MMYQVVTLCSYPHNGRNTACVMIIMFMTTMRSTMKRFSKWILRYLTYRFNKFERDFYYHDQPSAKSWIVARKFAEMHVLHELEVLLSLELTDAATTIPTPFTIWARDAMMRSKKGGRNLQIRGQIQIPYKVGKQQAFLMPFDWLHALY